MVADKVDVSDSAEHRQVGAVIVNSQGHILVGNTREAPGSWQYPAASVQTGESDLAAASRATWEACGWQSGVHMAPLAPLANANEASTMQHQEGEGGSPTEADQSVCWCAFRCMISFLDEDAAADCMVPLARQERSALKFSELRWQSLPDMLSVEDEEQLASLQILQRWLEPFLRHHDDAVDAIKFEGKWARSCLACTNMVEYQMALGHPLDRSWDLSTAPCVKLWQRAPNKGVWHVLSFDMHGRETQKALTYPIGEWYNAVDDWLISQPRRDEWGSTLKAYTAWLAEPDANDEGSSTCSGTDLLSPLQLAHSTVVTHPLGREEARHFMNAGRMILRRRFWPEDASETCVYSEELFFKID